MSVWVPRSQPGDAGPRPGVPGVPVMVAVGGRAPCANPHLAAMRKAAQAAYKRGESGSLALRVAVLELERELWAAERRRRRAVLLMAKARFEAAQVRRALADIGHAAVMRLGNPRRADRWFDVPEMARLRLELGVGVADDDRETLRRLLSEYDAQASILAAIREVLRCEPEDDLVKAVQEAVSGCDAYNELVNSPVGAAILGGKP